MSPSTRRGFVTGASLMLAVSAFVAAPASAQEDAPKGGTIVTGEWQSVTQLNPYLSNALRDFQGSYPVYRGLATIDNSGEFIPEFLTEFPTLENGGVVLEDDGDGFTLNLTLKEGLKWSDGTPLTMNDLKWNYEWAISTGKAGVGCPYCQPMAPPIDASLEGDALWAPENQYIESITVSDDGLSAVVKYRKNYAGWSGLVTQQLIAPQYWKDVPVDEIATRDVPGSPAVTEIPRNGPFLVSAASSEGIDYIPNPEWTADSGPNLDQLRMRFFGTKDGMFTAFLNGEIDLAINTTPADIATLQQVDPSVGVAQVDDGWLYEHLDFNTERSNLGLDDPKVRQALRMAINKQGLLDVLFPGAGMTPACSISPPTVWWASEVECAPYDPAAAAALLDEAGWTVDEALGWRAKDTDGDPNTPKQEMRLQMCTSSGNPTRLTSLGRISQDLQAISVPTNIQTQDPAVYFGSWEETTPETPCNIYRGTFDVALFTSQLSGDPYGNYYYSYHSSQPATEANPGGVAITRLANADMDAALDELASKVDPAGINAAADKIHQLVNELANEVPLYYRPEPTGVGNHLGGFDRKNPSTATSFWDVENWYFIP